jgi:hypothetical protein
MVGQLDVGVDGTIQPDGSRQRREPFGTPWSIEEVIEYVQRRDRGRIVKDACKQKHGDRVIVGGYGSRDNNEFMSSMSEGDGGVAG